MRVCFISFEYPPNILGGAGVYAEAIVNGLRRRGVDVFVIARGSRNDYDQKTFTVQTSNVAYWRRIFFMKPAVSLLNKLNKVLKFDLVHFNEPHIMLGKLNFPTVCTMHSTQVNEIMLKLADSRNLKTAKDITDLILKSPVGYIFDVFKVHAIDKIICPSPHLATLIESYCFVDKQKIRVIPNGVDLEALDEIKDYDADILGRYDLERDNYVLFVGRLSVLKGVQYLIETFRNIKKDYAKLKLVIVGTGDFENWLRKFACETEDVVFTGYVESPTVKKTLYENSLALVVPSLYEGLPMVILEAMANRKAVIASDTGGIPLLVRHGKNGFLAKPEDSKTLERFIRILLEDAKLRTNMGLYGRRLMEKEFTIDKMASETLNVYKLLV